MFKFSPYFGLRSPAPHAGSVRHIPGARHLSLARHIVFALVACVVSFLSSPLAAQSDEISWFDKYDEAIREAKRTGKPIFLEFRCER